MFMENLTFESFLPNPVFRVWLGVIYDDSWIQYMKYICEKSILLFIC